MNTEYPLVTSVVLSYKKFDFLYDAIYSILNQDYPCIELIISDDASGNFPKAEIEEFIKKNKKDNLVNSNIIINEKNLGTVKNFNNALKEGKGEYYICLSGDDCFYSYDVFFEVIKFFQRTGALIITTKRSVYDNEMNEEIQILPSISDQLYLINYNQNSLYNRLCFSNFISGACTFYSKKLFEKYGYFDEEYELLEDYPYYLKLSQVKQRIYFFDYISIKYRLGGISTSKIPNKKLTEDFRNLIKKEILPYKNQLGKKLYNLKEFDYYYKSSKKSNKIKAIIRHPLIFIIRVMDKCGIIKINIIDWILIKKTKK